MSWKHICVILTLAVLLVTSAVDGTALAQTSTSYNLEWHVIGGGGQPLASTHYVVHSTIGQGAASPPYSTGSQYAVSGGYWFAPNYRIYLPLAFRRHS